MQIIGTSAEAATSKTRESTVRNSASGSAATGSQEVDQRWQEQSERIRQQHAATGKHTHPKAALKNATGETDSTDEDEQVPPQPAQAETGLTQVQSQSLLTQDQGVAVPTIILNQTDTASSSTISAPGIGKGTQGVRPGSKTSAAQGSAQTTLADAKAQPEANETVATSDSVSSAPASPQKVGAPALGETSESSLKTAAITAMPVLAHAAPAMQHTTSPTPRTDLTAQVSADIAATPSADHQLGIRAAPGTLEVGLGTGTHGWVRVRASLAEDGTVSAQLLTASSGAAERLHKDLPALNTYLAEEQIGVSSTVVQAVNHAAAGQEATSGNSTAFTAGQQDSAASRGEQQNHSQDSGPAQAGDWEPQATALSQDVASPLSTAVFTSAGFTSGGWLSVRA